MKEAPAEQLLRKWQRDPELPGAIRQIGQRAQA
jgi:hypothetical protein